MLINDSGAYTILNNYNELQSLQNESAQVLKNNRDDVLATLTKKEGSLPKINMSAKTIWGTLIGNLRRLNLMTLHTACGEIRDVSLEDTTLKAVVNEDYLYNILTKGQNFEKISFYLRQIDDRINVQFNLVKKGTDFGLENLQKLKNFFGSELDEI